MRRIAIILIFFQLIGCTQLPIVTTRLEKKQEQKQEHETHQHDTPQAPKTNYLKIGGAVVGILAILASIGLIAYCCSRKGEKEPVTDQKKQNKEDKSLSDQKKPAKKIEEEIAEQDDQDINRIVPACAQLIRSDYSDIKDFILLVYSNEKELEKILRWHFLDAVPGDTMNARPGETNLSYQRFIVKTKLDNEIEQEREIHPNISISTLFANIESNTWCTLEVLKANLGMYRRNLTVYTRGIRWCGEEMARTLMNCIARIVYYYEFKDALLRSKK